MAASQKWELFFCNWPSSMPRKGVLQSVLNEAIPFKDFWLKDGMLLVERVTPDAMGARFVLLSFEVVNLLKLTNPLNAAEIAEAGFVVDLPKSKPKRQPQPAGVVQPAGV